MGDTPSQVQNVTVEDQGVNWRVGLQWRNPATGVTDWQTYEAQFPRDFGDINPDEVEPTMVALTLTVFANQDIIPE